LSSQDIVESKYVILSHPGDLDIKQLFSQSPKLVLKVVLIVFPTRHRPAALYHLQIFLIVGDVVGITVGLNEGLVVGYFVGQL
jgi:hypothetical protein